MLKGGGDWQKGVGIQGRGGGERALGGNLKEGPTILVRDRSVGRNLKKLS